MKEVIDDFEIFKNNNVIYLDSGATTQKPNYVINKVNDYYHKMNANPHRGSYGLRSFSGL